MPVLKAVSTPALPIGLARLLPILDRARADLLHAIIGRVNVRGSATVSVELTESAESQGLALALPEYVSVERPFSIRAAVACPRGLEPPTFRSAT